MLVRKQIPGTEQIFNLGNWGQSARQHLASTLKSAEECANLRIGPVLSANVFAADNAFAVDDVGLRPHVRMEERGGRFSGITHGDQVHVASSNEVCVGIGIFVNAYGQNNEIRLVAMQLENGRQFH